MEKLEVGKAGSLETLLEAIREVVRQELQAQESDYMDIERAAAFTTFTAGTLYVYATQKKVPAFKKNGKLVFKKSELIEWMERERKEKETPRVSVISHRGRGIRIG